MDDEQIKHMVDRFLGWRLPEAFRPDAGISFNPEYNIEYSARRGLTPPRHNPSGTNLFDATQAEAMVRYMVEGLPRERQLPHATWFDGGYLGNGRCSFMWARNGESATCCLPHGHEGSHKDPD